MADDQKGQLGPDSDAYRESVRRSREGVYGNVDARLDNRTGDDRPKLEEFPATPQQVSGPDLEHQREYSRAEWDKRAKGAGGSDAEGRKGQYSPGPHGLSDVELRGETAGKSEEVTFGTEGVTADEAGQGQPTVDALAPLKSSRARGGSKS